MPKISREQIQRMLADPEVEKTEGCVTKFAETYRSLGDTEKQMVTDIAKKWEKIAVNRAEKLDNDDLEHEEVSAVLDDENIEIQLEISPYFPFVADLTKQELGTAINGFTSFMFRKSKAN